MDIVVTVSNGVAVIYEDIPPGTYEINILKLPGYEPELYDESMVVTTTLTITEDSKESDFFVEAFGEATIIIKEQLGDGTIQDLPDQTAEGIVIRRCDKDGTPYETYISMAKNYEIFSNLPYSYNQLKEIADGPDVSLMIEPATLPDNYSIVGSSVVTKKLEKQQAADNEFVFLVLLTIKQEWHVYDMTAPLYELTDPQGTPVGYFGIDGRLTLTRKD